jgi:Asp/Glu/hydantoin racemase
VTLRIWHQSVTELDALPEYAESLAYRYAAVVSPGTEVVLHGVPVGTYGSSSPAETLPYPVERHRIAQLVLRQVEQAEREGFDAVMIASFAEPALREARSAVDIPVTSMAESALLAGCSIAGRVGIVTVSRSSVPLLEEGVERHRLGTRVATVVGLDPPVTEFDLRAAFEDPAAVRDAFERASRVAIDAGADAIVVGEGVLNEVVVGLGIREVDSVGVIDAIAVTALHTEMLVRGYEVAGLRTGRRWEYPRVPDDVRRALDTPRG